MRRLLVIWLLLIVAAGCFYQRSIADDLPLLGVGTGKGGAVSCGAFPSFSSPLFRFNVQPSNFTLSGSNLATIVDLSGSGNAPYTMGTNNVYSATGNYNSKASWTVSSNTVPATNGGFQWSAATFMSGSAVTFYGVGVLNQLGTNAYGRVFSYAANSGTFNDYDNNGSFAFFGDNVTSNLLVAVNNNAGIDTSFTNSAHIRFGFTISGTSIITYKNGSLNQSYSGGGALSMVTGGFLAVNNGSSGGSPFSAAALNSTEFVEIAAWGSALSGPNISTLDTWETCTYGS